MKPPTKIRRNDGDLALHWRLVQEAAEGFRGSVAALWAHRLRFFLSTLGIIVGILTVTLMGGAIEAHRQAFERSVSAMYTDVLFLKQYPWYNKDPWWEFRERPKITLQEAEAIRAQARFAADLVYEATSERDVSGASDTARSITVVGVTEGIAAFRQISLQAGRFFSALDVSTARPVCVLAPDAVETLFSTGEVVGRTVRIEGQRYEIIGVTDRLGNVFGRSLDSRIFIPITRFQVDLARDPALAVMLRVADINAMADAREEMRGIMRRVRRLLPDQKDDFAIEIPELALSDFHKTNATIAAAGYFITGLSLLVGSIGITNIMYVSVRERTQEIGLRKALGARRRMILLQFLVEGMIVCLLGALVAVGLALGLSHPLSRFQAIEVSPTVLLVSLLVALVTGIMAALLPAWEAARMQPTEALRSD